MSIAQNFPEIRPSLNLDFANVKALDPRVTFARASTGAYYDGQTVAKAEENLFQYSQEFDNAAWSKGSVTVTANTTVAPDGTTTAETLTQPASPTTSQLSQTVTVQSGSTVTFSLFAKKNVGDWLRCAVGSGSNYFICSFDLQNGIVGTSVNLGTGVLVAANIAASTNGFYRVSITGNIPSTTSYPALTFVADADNSGTRLANGSAFIWGAQLEQRSAVTAYTPTTTQPITNYIPVLQTASANVARFDHNPVTGESLGLLVEEQRTNLLTYSEDFADASWSKANSTITSNTIVAPDGTLTGDKIVSNNSTTATGVSKNITATATAYTATYFVKYAGTQFVQLLWAGVSGTYANFDLVNGTVTAGSYTSATITDVGNGFYRISLTSTLVAGTVGSNLWLQNSGTAPRAAAYTGDGYSGIYIWGAQLEAGAFPTSYIPTVASQVTRSADSASMTGTNFSDWYRQDEGTVYVEAQAPEATLGYVFHLFSQVGTNRYFLTKVSTTSMRFTVFNGATLASLNKTIDAESIKYAVGIELDNYALVKDGDTPVLDTSALILKPDTLQIGANNASAAQINGHIRKLSYYPQRLTDTQLQAITG